MSGKPPATGKRSDQAGKYRAGPKRVSHVAVSADKPQRPDFIHCVENQGLLETKPAYLMCKGQRRDIFGWVPQSSSFRVCGQGEF